MTSNYFQVELYSNDYYEKIVPAKEWAVENCESICNVEDLDLSDFNHTTHDCCLIITFTDEQEALMYRLKWT